MFLFSGLGLIYLVFLVNLTNLKWFRVDCTLIDNDTHHHVEPPSICLMFTTIFNTKESKVFISEHDQNHDIKKEQALSNFLAI